MAAARTLAVRMWPKTRSSGSTVMPPYLQAYRWPPSN